MKKDVAAAVNLTGRTCGTCSMCCKIPPVPKLEKPENTWCRHCRPGKAGGCTIYESRPDVCKDFACGWLMYSGYGDEWKPSVSKIVIRTLNQSSGPICQFMVDPSVPHRWREKPYYDTIKRVAFNGLNAIGTSRFQTHVRTGGSRSFLILPTKDFETRDDEVVMVFNVGTPWEWEAKRFETSEQARQFGEEMNRKRTSLGLPPSKHAG